MNPAQVLKLAIIAAHLSGYSLPSDPPPAVRELSSRQMDVVACRPEALPDDGCHQDVGMYLDGGEIYVDTEYLRTAAHTGTEDDIVLHELVHWLQYAHAWGGTGCPHLQARENEAYRVQNLYIRQYEPGRKLFTTATVCE